MEVEGHEQIYMTKSHIFRAALAIGDFVGEWKAGGPEGGNFHVRAARKSCEWSPSISSKADTFIEGTQQGSSIDKAPCTGVLVGSPLPPKSRSDAITTFRKRRQYLAQLFTRCFGHS